MDFVEETSVKHKKNTADFVVLVEVLAFPLWKSATLVTFLYGRSRLRLNICSASHFIHVSAYGYVSLTIKEDSLKVWYDYVVRKFWLFVSFRKYSIARAETPLLNTFSIRQTANRSLQLRVAKISSFTGVQFSSVHFYLAKI